MRGQKTRIRMKSWIIVLIVAVAVVTAILALTAILSHTPVFDSAKNAPGGTSSQAVYAHLKPILQPWEDVAAANADALPPETRQGLFDALAAAVSLYQNDDNGKIALAHLADDARDLIRTARRNEKWQLALDGTDVFGAFRKNEFFLRFYREMAQNQLARPEVSLRGFLEDIPNKTLYAFVDVRIPGSNKTLSLQVRPGDEFLEPPHSLRFVEVIGANLGIRLEFLLIPGDTFDVLLKKQGTGR